MWSTVPLDTSWLEKFPPASRDKKATHMLADLLQDGVWHRYLRRGAVSAVREAGGYRVQGRDWLLSPRSFALLYRERPDGQYEAVERPVWACRPGRSGRVVRCQRVCLTFRKDFFAVRGRC